MKNIEFLNKSFARRIGKSLSKVQKFLIEETLPLHLFDSDKISLLSNSQIFLEIGIGMGEHFMNQAKFNPSANFIGVDPYLNGIANALKISKIESITNFMLLPDNADLILTKIPLDSLSGVYILFPDPWPKTNQKKRRFVSSARLNMLYNLLKPGAFLVFASDIEDYFFNVLSECEKIGFKLLSTNFSQPHENYVQTKFHSKAIIAGRQPQFMQMIKL